MYKFIKKQVSFTPVIKVKNQQQLRLIDAVEGDFVMNKYGHIRSDFATLVDSSDASEMARALQSMQAAYEEDVHKYDGMTFEQIVQTLRPRWCQLPGEVDRFEQYLIDNALDFYKQLRDDAKTIAELDGVDTPPPATLSPEQPSGNS